VIASITSLPNAFVIIKFLQETLGNRRQHSADLFPLTETAFSPAPGLN
jgi:hypothetical protein